MNALKINAEVKNNRKPAKKPVKKASRKPYTRSELVRVGAFVSVAVCGLAVSLPHLAHEVTTLTGASVVAGWFLSLVIDAGMVITKAHLSSGGSNKVVAWSVVAACTLVSIVLNAHAFHAQSTGTFGQIAAIGFGIFLPLFILAQSFLASEILNRK